MFIYIRLTMNSGWWWPHWQCSHSKETTWDSVDSLRYSDQARKSSLGKQRETIKNHPFTLNHGRCLLVNVPMVEISTPTDRSSRSTGKPLFVSWREEADSFDRPGWLTTATAVLWHGRLSSSESCYKRYAPVNSHSYWTLKWHNSLQYLPIRKGDLSWLC